jgi:RimJ/RimL family protein N-acetyltransferase
MQPSATPESVSGQMTQPTLDYSRYFWQAGKVRLRPLRIEDAEQGFIHSLDSPARQTLQLGIELPTSLELARASLERFVGCKDFNGVIVFAIENLAGEHVGGISLHSRDEKNGLFSFGIVIYREHRKKGYAQDAVRILLKYGFWERRYQKCDSACAHDNEGSIALHKGLGFLEEGRRRRALFCNGAFHDEILFGMTREEFDERAREWWAAG